MSISQKARNMHWKHVEDLEQEKDHQERSSELCRDRLVESRDLISAKTLGTDCSSFLELHPGILKGKPNLFQPSFWALEAGDNFVLYHDGNSSKGLIRNSARCLKFRYGNFWFVLFVPCRSWWVWEDIRAARCEEQEDPYSGQRAHLQPAVPAYLETSKRCRSHHLFWFFCKAKWFQSSFQSKWERPFLSLCSWIRFDSAVFFQPAWWHISWFQRAVCFHIQAQYCTLPRFLFTWLTRDNWHKEG